MPHEAHQELTGQPADDLSQAITELVPDLLTLARRLTVGRHAADDLVHDTVVRSLQARSSFRGEASVRTWLHRIMWNLAVDRSRQGSRELLVDEVEDRWRDDTYTVDPVVVSEQAADADRLRDALVRLPFIYRSAVVLHDSLGWTHAEIADRLEISVDNAKQRVHRGRMLLTSALAEEAGRQAALKGVVMKCWDAREQVGDYLDGTLPAPAASQLEAHLAACPTCPPLYASLVGATAALGTIRDSDTTVPPALATKVAAALAGAATRRGPDS